MEVKGYAPAEVTIDYVRQMDTPAKELFCLLKDN